MGRIRPSSPGPPSAAPGEPNRGAGVFATTHWSVVLLAQAGEELLATEALEKLCRAYWYPLYAFLRRQGRSPVDARELTQAFLAAGKSGLFDALQRFQNQEPDSTTSAEVAVGLGMPENTFKSHLLRFRRRYRELICEEVAQTVGTPADVTEELQHLKVVLAG